MVETVTFGQFRVSLTRGELWKDGEPAVIGRRALGVLIALCRRPGELVTKDDLASEVWGGAAVEDNTIAAQIAALRRVLGDGVDGARYIQTVPGRGYRFIARTGAPPSIPVTTSGDDEPGAAASARRRRSWAIAGARWRGVAAAAAAALVVAILVWGRAAPRWDIDRMSTIAESPLVETEAAPSPDGAMLAYAAGAERDHRRIFLRRLAGGEPLAFTAGDGDESAPAWSPGGDRIAFIRGRDGQPCVILVKPVLAGPEREVGRCRTLRSSTLVWPRDGAAIYFHDRPTPDSASRIMRLDVAAGGTVAVTRPPPGSDGDVTPGLSPDGRRLVFQRSTDLLTAVFVRDLATGSERRITSGAINISGADWVDDRTLVVATNPPDPSALWTYDLDGGPPRRLTLNPAEFQHLVSGGGGLVGFENHNYRNALVYAAKGLSSAPELIETRSGLINGLNATIAGDLTFARAPGGWGPWEIWVRRQGGPARQVTTLNASYAEGPRWSPDGRMIAFEATIGGTTGVYVMTSTGTGLRRLTRSVATMGGPAWTADGRRLVFPMISREGWSLWQVDVDHPGEEAPLGRRGWAAVRSDGQALYGLNVEGGVWRLAPAPRLIVPGISALHLMEWDVVAGRVIVLERPLGGGPRLVVRATSGGRDRIFAAPRPLVDDPANTAGAIGGVSFDPKADRPVYVQAAGGEVQVGVFHLKRR